MPLSEQQIATRQYLIDSYGVEDAALMLSLYELESNSGQALTNNTTSASGAFQITRGTWGTIANHVKKQIRTGRLALEDLPDGMNLRNIDDFEAHRFDFVDNAFMANQNLSHIESRYLDRSNRARRRAGQAPIQSFDQLTTDPATRLFMLAGGHKDGPNISSKGTGFGNFINPQSGEIDIEYGMQQYGEARARRQQQGATVASDGFGHALTYATYASDKAIESTGGRKLQLTPSQVARSMQWRHNRRLDHREVKPLLERVRQFDPGINPEAMTEDQIYDRIDLNPDTAAYGANDVRVTDGFEVVNDPIYRDTGAPADVNLGTEQRRFSDNPQEAAEQQAAIAAVQRDPQELARTEVSTVYNDIPDFIADTTDTFADGGTIFDDVLDEAAALEADSGGEPEIRSRARTERPSLPNAQDRGDTNRRNDTERPTLPRDLPAEAPTAAAAPPAAAPEPPAVNNANYTGTRASIELGGDTSGGIQFNADTGAATGEYLRNIPAVGAQRIERQKEVIGDVLEPIANLGRAVGNYFTSTFKDKQIGVRQARIESLRSGEGVSAFGAGVSGRDPQAIIAQLESEIAELQATPADDTPEGAGNAAPTLAETQQPRDVTRDRFSERTGGGRGNGAAELQTRQLERFRGGRGDGTSELDQRNFDSTFADVTNALDAYRQEQIDLTNNAVALGESEFNRIRGERVQDRRNQLIDEIPVVSGAQAVFGGGTIEERLNPQPTVSGEQLQNSLDFNRAQADVTGDRIRANDIAVDRTRKGNGDSLRQISAGLNTDFDQQQKEADIVALADYQNILSGGLITPALLRDAQAGRTDVTGDQLSAQTAAARLAAERNAISQYLIANSRRR